MQVAYKYRLTVYDAYKYKYNCSWTYSLGNKSGEIEEANSEYWIVENDYIYFKTDGTPFAAFDELLTESCDHENTNLIIGGTTITIVTGFETAYSRDDLRAVKQSGSI